MLIGHCNHVAGSVWHRISNGIISGGDFHARESPFDTIVMYDSNRAQRQTEHTLAGLVKSSVDTGTSLDNSVRRGIKSCGTGLPFAVSTLI